MNKRRWIYIAAPYTAPDPVENTHKAIKVAVELHSLGFFPVIPHLTLLFHMVVPYPTEFWYDYTLEMLRRCDAVLRVPGLSKGAMKEEEEARKLKIPVFYSIKELKTLYHPTKGSIMP